MAEKHDPETHNMEHLSDDASETKESSILDSAEIERDKISESSMEEPTSSSSMQLQEHYSEAVCECVCPCETCEEMRSFGEGEDSMHLCVCTEECSEEYFVPEELLCRCGGEDEDDSSGQAMYSLHCCTCGVQLSTMELYPKRPSPSSPNEDEPCVCNRPDGEGPSGEGLPNPRGAPTAPPPPPMPQFPIGGDNINRASVPPTLSLLRVLSCGDGSASDTRLHEAARSGRTEDLVELLKNPQLMRNINSRVKPFMSTPLREAVVGGSAGCVQELLSRGAEVDAVDVKGQTALFLAASLEHAHIMELLLSAGADPEGSRYNNSTPLLLCVRDGSLEGVQALLRHNVNPEPLGQVTSSVPGWPLQHSIVYQYLDCFLALLKGGAQPDLREILSKRIQQSESLNQGVLHRLSITRTILRHASERPEFIRVYREFGGPLDSPSGLPEDMMVTPTPASQALVAALEEPLPLVSLCRIALRKLVGAPRLPALAEQAELPGSLRHFLAYRDMDKYCYSAQ